MVLSNSLRTIINYYYLSKNPKSNSTLSRKTKSRLSYEQKIGDLLLLLDSNSKSRNPNLYSI